MTQTDIYTHTSAYHTITVTDLGYPPTRGA
jgi:hypothetical protein